MKIIHKLHFRPGGATDRPDELHVRRQLHLQHRHPQHRRRLLLRRG